MSTRHLYATFKFHDARRAMRLLAAMGFTETAVHADEGDPTRVAHAEYAWRDHGGVMFGSVGMGSADLDARAGHGTCYCVTTDDAEVDRVHAAALEAGATSVEAPHSPPYGGRACAVRDPEGNIFGFGSYAGS